MKADVEGAKLAAERAAAIVHRKMGRGRASLAAIASSAFFVGIVGTVFAIFNSFVGCDGEKSTCMAAVTLNLSNAIIPTAAGLLIALLAWWGNRCLCVQLKVFDVEMRATTLELANSLSLFRQRIRE